MLSRRVVVATIVSSLLELGVSVARPFFGFIAFIASLMVIVQPAKSSVTPPSGPPRVPNRAFLPVQQTDDFVSGSSISSVGGTAQLTLDPGNPYNNVYTVHYFASVTINASIFPHQYGTATLVVAIETNTGSGWIERGTWNEQCSYLSAPPPWPANTCSFADQPRSITVAGLGLNTNIRLKAKSFSTTNQVGGSFLIRGGDGAGSNPGTFNGVYYFSANPAVSLAPYSGGTRSVDPFDVVQAVTTPAYQSVGAWRAATLVYNSSTVRPTPVVSVDVSVPAGTYTAYQLRVQLISNSTFLTLLNGSTSVYYAAPPDTTATRLVAAIDAKANLLSTGWYDVNVIITPYNGSTPGPATTVTTRFLVDDESGSLFGAGWQLAGLQRLSTMPGSYSALITNGDGSMSFFQRDCPTCAFISPAGDPTRLVLYSGPDTGIAYRRAAPDSSAIDFRSDGRMVRAWSGALYRAVVIANWSGTQLLSIQDLIGKRLTFGYTGPASQSGKLQTITDPLGRVTTIWTDSEGKLYRVTDPDSLTTLFAYDASIRLTSVTDRAAATTILTYDVLNRIDSTKAPTITDYTGSPGQPVGTATAPERIAWQPATAGTSLATAKAIIRPDTLSAKIVDPLGNVTRIAFDQFAGATKVVDALGQVMTIQRDTLGQVRSVHTPTGHAETRTYSGYLLMSTYDSTTKQSRSYTYNGFSLVQTITGNGGTTRQDFYYKAAYPGSGDFGLLDSVYIGNTSGSHASPSDGFWAAFYEYNAWGQDSLVTDGVGHQTMILHSDTAHFSNPRQVIDPYGRLVSQMHYDGAGRPDTIWSPSNGGLAPTVLGYDQMNRTRSTKDPLGLTTQFVYGPTTLNRVVDAKGQVYRFDYNALGWGTVNHDLADTTKADTVKYDVGGRVRTVRTRRGDAISLTYDALGRVLTRSGPEFPVDSFRYDPAGRWVVAVNENAYDSVAFDIAGRVVYSRERLTGDSNYILTFTYDTLGRVKTRSAPRLGSALTFGYNPGRGTLDTVCAGGQCSVWTNRDGDNIPHTVRFGVNNPQNFQMQVYTDNTHRIVADSFTGPTSYIQQLDTAFSKTWTYDTLGRVTNEWPYGSTWGAGGFRYAYDADGQLTLACLDQTTFIFPPGELDPSCIDEYGRDKGWGFSTQNPYRYDSTGNRIDSAAVAVVGPGNRMLQFKRYVLAYDLNGNTISKKGLGGAGPTDTTLFIWDAANRLTGVERWIGAGAHTVVTYAYDALGRRVAKTVGGITERYVHDGDQVILDIDGATHGLKAEYTWLPGAMDRLLYIRTTSWTAGVIKDPMNNTVRGFANLINGQPMKQYVASYWGEVSPDTGFVVRFRHAGREYDAEAGIYYNRARYYDPQLGRFLSEDPIGIAGGLNLYAYAGNDPVSVSDPTGTSANCPPNTLCGNVPVERESHPECAGANVPGGSVECRLEADRCVADGGTWSWSYGTCDYDGVGNGAGSGEGGDSGGSQDDQTEKNTGKCFSQAIAPTAAFLGEVGVIAGSAIAEGRRIASSADAALTTFAGYLRDWESYQAGVRPNETRLLAWVSAQVVLYTGRVAAERSMVAVGRGTAAAGGRLALIAGGVAGVYLLATYVGCATGLLDASQ